MKTDKSHCNLTAEWKQLTANPSSQMGSLFVLNRFKRWTKTGLSKTVWCSFWKVKYIILDWLFITRQTFCRMIFSCKINTTDDILPKIYLAMINQSTLCSNTYLQASVLTRKDNILHLTVMESICAKEIDKFSDNCSLLEAWSQITL